MNTNHWNADDSRFWIRSDRSRLAAWVKAVADLQSGHVPSPNQRPASPWPQRLVVSDGILARNPRL
jgi:hypothetical protein